MKKLLYLSLAMYVLVLASGCQSNDEKDIKGVPITSTSCNAIKSSDSLTLPSDQSCVFYAYDPIHKTLALIHKNAGFNCCPGKIYYTADITNNTISIEESESTSGCNCNCLYDLDIELQNILPVSYTLKIIEPYRENQEELLFEIDLLDEIQGSYCVTRNNYPWGITN